MSSWNPGEELTFFFSESGRGELKMGGKGPLHSRDLRLASVQLSGGSKSSEG